MIGPHALRITALLALSALAASCTAAKNTQTVKRPDGTVEQNENKVVAVGGRGANSNRGTAWDNEKSWGQTMMMAGTVGVGVTGAIASKATEATKQAAAASAAKTQQAKIAADAATKQAAISANAGAFNAAVGAGAAPTVGTVIPPAP